MTETKKTKRTWDGTMLLTIAPHPELGPLVTFFAADVGPKHPEGERIGAVVTFHAGDISMGLYPDEARLMAAKLMSLADDCEGARKAKEQPPS